MWSVADGMAACAKPVPSPGAWEGVTSTRGRRVLLERRAQTLQPLAPLTSTPINTFSFLLFRRLSRINSLPHHRHRGTDDEMENAFNAVTHGVLRRITAGEEVMDPVLQCVQIKPMAQGAGGQERWRVVFSDTVNFIQGMISMRE